MTSSDFHLRVEEFRPFGLVVAEFGNSGLSLGFRHSIDRPLHCLGILNYPCRDCWDVLEAVGRIAKGWKR